MLQKNVGFENISDLFSRVDLPPAQIRAEKNVGFEFICDLFSHADLPPAQNIVKQRKLYLFFARRLAARPNKKVGFESNINVNK